MKVSEVTTEVIQSYLRTDENEEVLDIFWDAAVSYVKQYTGLTSEQMDTSPDISICCLAVMSDMYDNRQMQTTGTNYSLNHLVDSMLSMHARNLLPSE